MQIQTRKRNSLKIIESDPFEAYEITGFLGKGGSGLVHKVRKINGTLEFALKVIDCTQIQAENTLNEFIYTYNTACENIVCSHELYKYQNHYYIVEELMETNLSDFIKKNGVLPEKAMVYILKEILLGLVHIHSKGIIHRDLKTENIFIDKSGTIKIGDFGEIAQLTLEQDQKCSIRGSPYWMAPEVCRGSPYTTLSDIWSLGIIIYELTQGRPPYTRLPYNQVFTEIIANPPPCIGSKWTEKFKSFAEMCLQKNPIARSSPHQLLNTPLIKKVSNKGKEYIINNLL
jgi:serine/threonine protein kinase